MLYIWQNGETLGEAIAEKLACKSLPAQSSLLSKCVRFSLRWLHGFSRVHIGFGGGGADQLMCVGRERDPGEWEETHGYL